MAYMLLYTNVLLLLLSGIMYYHIHYVLAIIAGISLLSTQ